MSEHPSTPDRWQLPDVWRWLIIAMIAGTLLVAGYVIRACTSTI